MKPKQLIRKLIIIAPLLAVGLCFQNFTEPNPELVFPEMPAADPNVKYGTTSTSPEAAAEEFVRTQWMPELRNIEQRVSEKLQFRFDKNSPESAEIEMNVVGRGPATMDEEHSPQSGLQVSVVNDRLRFRFTGVEAVCDYAPTKDLVSLKTEFRSPNQIQLEHSGRDQVSRLSWQMSW